MSTLSDSNDSLSNKENSFKPTDDYVAIEQDNYAFKHVF